MVPDVLTDQTSAHDPLNGYVPNGMTPRGSARAARGATRSATRRESFRTMKEHCAAMIELQRRGADTFDYGNNLRGHAQRGRARERLRLRGLRAEVHPAAVLRGPGPVPLGGAVRRPSRTSRSPTASCSSCSPRSRRSPLDPAWRASASHFQGLPARICWLGYGERAQAGLAFNEAVRKGEISAPVVIGRDHLDCGSVASPNRETEAMQDGTDAVADWPLLNCMLNVASGASWVSFHHGGGVGMGYSLHAGQVTVADGTPEAAEAHRARAHQRPRHRRHAPRRRGLRGGHALRARAAASTCRWSTDPRPPPGHAPQRSGTQRRLASGGRA